MMHEPEPLPIILEKIRGLFLIEPNFTAEQLVKIAAPTLILDGQNENLIRLEGPQKVAALIPNAQLIILPNVGHSAVTENLATWNQAVLDFLKNN